MYTVIEPLKNLIFKKVKLSLLTYHCSISNFSKIDGSLNEDADIYGFLYNNGVFT